MNQKICVISFDHWNYDVHIVDALKKKGVDSFHIKLGAYKHKSVLTRISNTFSKVFLGKNPKHIKRQEYILECLKEKGFQDQILVINPELIDLDFHLNIKKFTNKYIAYLYDSVSRCPVEHLLNGVFDDIFSFDKDDCKKYQFKETSNYIYFDKNDFNNKILKDDFVYIGSIDERLELVEKIGQFLKLHNKSFKFYAVGKKATWYAFKNRFTNQFENITFRRKRISQSETLNIYSHSNVIIDIVRKNQTGLSFRIFEAIGLNKNVLTNNKIIVDYDILKSGKIHLIGDECYNIDNMSFETKNYSDELYHKYHLNSWVEKVFNVT